MLLVSDEQGNWAELKAGKVQSLLWRTESRVVVF